MTAYDTLPRPVVGAAGTYAGLWLRGTTFVGLVAGLSGTVATAFAIDAFAKLFQPHHERSA